MRQGSYMAQGHKGMRKGISLVEMLVAIVLFGIISTISYTYYKNYYDTSLAAKQLRVYTIVDQAAQISNAFDLYNTKNAEDPTTLDDLVTDRILTQIPTAQPFVTATGWTLEDNKSISAADNNGTAFVYPIDATNLTPQDVLDYCNILNNVAYKDSNMTKVLTDQNTTVELYPFGLATATSEQEFFHCEDLNDGAAGYDGFQFVFVKRATKSM